MLALPVLSIGSHNISTPAIQAALAGFSSRPMRMVARRHGAEFAMAEVVLDETVLLHGKLRRRLFAIGADDHPIGGQLMGSQPEQFAEAASALVEGGYDSIDINFGCPVRKALGRCRGGYLLSEPFNALTIVKSVIDAVGGRRPVTLKMRRGLDESPESESNFFAILDGAFSYGVAAITVHGRTVRQRYVGPSDWSFLKRVKRHVGTRTIIGSGDLFTASSLVRMMEETGVDGCSVARGAIGNPFIFREFRALREGRPLIPPTVQEQRAAIELHLLELSKTSEEVYWGTNFRKFGIAYSDLHPMRDEVRQAFMRATTTPVLFDVLRQWYDPEREWPQPQPRQSVRDLIAAGAQP